MVKKSGLVVLCFILLAQAQMYSIENIAALSSSVPEGDPAAEAESNVPVKPVLSPLEAAESQAFAGKIMLISGASASVLGLIVLTQAAVPGAVISVTGLLSAGVGGVLWLNGANKANDLRLAEIELSESLSFSVTAPGVAVRYRF
jgi:hypothetical protein